MIRLQVVQDKVVDLVKSDARVLQAILKLPGGIRPIVDQVDKRSFFASHDIHIQGNPLRDGPNPFKKIGRRNIRMEAPDRF
jgi:hypothetical protein